LRRKQEKQNDPEAKCLSKKLCFRKCIGCATVKDRVQMIRIMKLHDSGNLIINPTATDFGRSYYICYNIDCVNKLFKKKRFEKIIKKEVPAEIKKYLESIEKN